MVRKIAILTCVAFLHSISAQADTRGLLLNWSGSRSSSCQKLIEAFLTELRSMASDRVIELEAYPSKTETADEPLRLSIRCSESGPAPANTIEVSDATQSAVLRYLEKAGGFDSMDWLQVQEKFLRDTAAPAPGANPMLLQPASAAAPVAAASGKPGPVFRRAWFWSAVAGAVLSGAYLLHSRSRTTGISVEIR